MLKDTYDDPTNQRLEGQYVRLEPLDFTVHGNALYDSTHKCQGAESHFDYLPYGPFESADAMIDILGNNLSADRGVVPWCIVDKGSNLPVGITSLLATVSAHARTEIGHVQISPTVRRSPIHTEAQFLVLSYVFDDLGYRRVEWKCDSRNQKSREAAARLGFLFEGRFRKHMISRGRSRDSDYFAMTDLDWPLRRKHLEQALYGASKVSLSALNT